MVDLEAACELYGRPVLPYPLGRSQPVGAVWRASREVAPIEDRLHSGDLRGVRAQMEALVRADVCVEYRLSYSGEVTPYLRGTHCEPTGWGMPRYKHSDRDGLDVVDICAVSPEVSGAVVADSVGLVGAGAHARIAVSRRGDRLPALPEMVDEDDGFGFPIPHAGRPGPAAVTIAGRDVVAPEPCSRGTTRLGSGRSGYRLRDFTGRKIDGLVSDRSLPTRRRRHSCPDRHARTVRRQLVSGPAPVGVPMWGRRRCRELLARNENGDICWKAPFRQSSAGIECRRHRSGEDCAVTACEHQAASRSLSYQHPVKRIAMRPGQSAGHDRVRGVDIDAFCTDA